MLKQGVEGRYEGVRALSRYEHILNKSDVGSPLTPLKQTIELRKVNLDRAKINPPSSTP
jgi:hypothetical protein